MKETFVNQERRKVQGKALILGVLGLVAIFVIVAFLGLPWYVGAIASVVFGFVVLWIAGEKEDKVLVKNYGAWKK